MRIWKLTENVAWQPRQSLYSISYPSQQLYKKEAPTLRPTIESNHIVILYEWSITLSVLIFRKQNRFMLRIWENGILERLRQKTFKPMPKRCQPWGQQKQVGNTPLKLKEFFGIFVLYIGGCITAVVIFLAELLIARLKWLLWLIVSSNWLLK